MATPKQEAARALMSLASTTITDNPASRPTAENVITPPSTPRSQIADLKKTPEQPSASDKKAKKSSRPTITIKKRRNRKRAGSNDSYIKSPRRKTHITNKIPAKNIDPDADYVETSSPYNENGETDICHKYCYRTDHDGMIQCDGAACRGQWFHISCVGFRAMPPQVLKEGVQWYCLECRVEEEKGLKTDGVYVPPKAALMEGEKMDGEALGDSRRGEKMEVEGEGEFEVMNKEDDEIRVEWRREDGGSEENDADDDGT